MRTGSRIGAAVLIAAVALGSAGCGVQRGSVSGDRVAALGENGGSSVTAAELPLSMRLLRSSRLPSFHGIAQPAIVHDPRRWASDSGITGSLAAAVARQLAHLGFVAGVREDLFARDPLVAEVVSIVEQFRTATGAHAQLADQYQQAREAGRSPGHAFTALTVEAIPAGIGYEMAIPGSLSRTVAFTSGQFYYLIRAFAPPAERDAPTWAQQIAAVAHLHQRVAANDGT